MRKFLFLALEIGNVYSDERGIIGGAEVQQRYIIDFLKRENECHVILYDDYRIDSRENIYFHPIIPSKFNLLKLFLCIINIFKVFIKIKPSVVYHRATLKLVFIILIFSKIMNSKYIHAIANDNTINLMNNRSIYGRILKSFIKHSSIVTVQNSYQYNYMIKIMDQKKVKLLNNFYPDKSFNFEINIEDKDIDLIWVGSISKKKNLEFLINNFDYIKKFFKTIVIIGGPCRYNRKYSEQIIKKIQTLDVQYLGNQNHLTTLGYIRRSKYYLNTSKKEGFPNTFLEAWANKTIIISLSQNPNSVFSKKDMGLLLKNNIKNLTEENISNYNPNEIIKIAYKYYSKSNNIGKYLELFYGS